MFSNSERDKDKIDEEGIVPSVVSRLSLDNHFGRWRLLQNILAGEADPVDANETLGLMLSTHISSSDRRSSDDLILMEDQVCTIESLLEIGTAACEGEEKYPCPVYIPALGNATTNPDPNPNADSSVMLVPYGFRFLWLVASRSMANEVLAFLLYGWTLPLLVPVFALVKSVAGATPVWAVEEWLLAWHTHDLRLFAHLRLAYARRAVSYRLHAGAAGVALLALLVLVLRTPAHPWLLRCTYLAASTLMALCGAKLVPTMYAGRHGRWWTRVQYKLLLAYNLAWLVGPPRARHFADHLALWLLLCAGVGERFNVLFFKPTRPAYDRQFAVATKCSWVFGVLSATFCM